MWPWLVACLTLAADQLSKQLVLATLQVGESIPVIPHVLHLTYVQNTGAAFGLFKGLQPLFVLLAIVVIGWLARELRARTSPADPVAWGCALVLGGALGNLADRLRLFYVVDFIDIRIWPVFNIGDSAITIGVILLLWQSLMSARHATRDAPQ